MTELSRSEPLAEVTPAKRDGQRVLVVRWSEGNATISAELARVGDIPVLVRVTVDNPRDLPWDSRTVPTEARVLGMVQEQGTEGWQSFLYLMDESIFHEGTLSEINEEVIRGQVHAYQRKLFRKPHSRRPELIELAGQLDLKGTRTQDIVNELTMRGVSESTAFRYLRRARTADSGKSPG